MRNPERLDKFYAELCEIHKKHFPDWRFGQLVVNVASECGRDFFFPESRKHSASSASASRLLPTLKRILPARPSGGPP